MAIKQDVKETSVEDRTVIQSWTTTLTWKMQTVLMSSLRGCDTVSKNDTSKQFTRFIRNAFLKNAGEPNSEFITHKLSDDVIYAFSKEFDQYPIHYILHLMNAFEIIAYKHPDLYTAELAYKVYETMVHAFHMNIEDVSEMNFRLRDGVDTCCHKT